jgi:hypothetical protein
MPTIKSTIRKITRPLRVQAPPKALNAPGYQALIKAFRPIEETVNTRPNGKLVTLDPKVIAAARPIVAVRSGWVPFPRLWPKSMRPEIRKIPSTAALMHIIARDPNLTPSQRQKLITLTGTQESLRLSKQQSNAWREIADAERNPPNWLTPVQHKEQLRRLTNKELQARFLQHNFSHQRDALTKTQRGP